MATRGQRVTPAPPVLRQRNDVGVRAEHVELRRERRGRDARTEAGTGDAVVEQDDVDRHGSATPRREHSSVVGHHQVRTVPPGATRSTGHQRVRHAPCADPTHVPNTQIHLLRPAGRATEGACRTSHNQLRHGTDTLISVPSARNRFTSVALARA